MVNSEVEFFISDKKIKLEDEDGNYIFWVAFLNSENEENERSIRTMYGYTELLPGQITADTLISSDGNSYMDFLLNQFRIGNKKTSLEWNMDDDEKLAIKNATFEINDSNGEAVARIDGESGAAMFGKSNVILNADGSASFGNGVHKFNIDGSATFGNKNQFYKDGSGKLANGSIVYDSNGNLDIKGLFKAQDGSVIAGMTIEGDSMWGTSATFSKSYIFTENEIGSVVAQNFKRRQTFMLYSNNPTSSYYWISLPNDIIQPGLSGTEGYDFSLKFIVKHNSTQSFAITTPNLPNTKCKIVDNEGNICHFGPNTDIFLNGAIVMSKGDVLELYCNDGIYYIINHRY